MGWRTTSVAILTAGPQAEPACGRPRNRGRHRSLRSPRPGPAAGVLLRAWAPVSIQRLMISFSAADSLSLPGGILSVAIFSQRDAVLDRAGLEDGLPIRRLGAWQPWLRKSSRPFASDRHGTQALGLQDRQNVLFEDRWIATFRLMTDPRHGVRAALRPSVDHSRQGDDRSADEDDESTMWCDHGSSQVGQENRLLRFWVFVVPPLGGLREPPKGGTTNFRT